MTTKSGKRKVENAICFFLLTLYFCLAMSCSIPKLESPECTEARDALREFYSFHFASDMHLSRENIELRSKFVTPSYKEFLEQSYINWHDIKPVDEFTKTAGDRPKTFRIGKCSLDESNRKADVEVVLFWKDDQRSAERTIKVNAIKDEAGWLINDIVLLPE